MEFIGRRQGAKGNKWGLPSTAGGGGPVVPLAIIRGYNPLIDHGTIGDKYVSPTGSDANSGSIAAPYLNLDYALTQLNPGQHLKMRGGVYPKIANLSGKGGSLGARTKISRYGTEQVVIDAQDVFGSFVQCGAGDATVLGATLGVLSSPVYKFSTPKATFPGSDPRAAFPFENSVKLNAVMGRKPDPARPDLERPTDDWLTATTVVQQAALNYDGTVGAFTVGQVVTGATSGATGTIVSKTTTQLVFSVQSGTFVDNETITDPLGGNALANKANYTVITGYRLSTLTSLYTTAQLQNADVLFYGGSNETFRTKVASFGTGTDGVANTINLTDSVESYNGGQVASNKFALINILPALKPGEWGFTDDDATNCTIYVYPTSAANMAANLKMTTRGRCIDLGTSTSHLEVQGIIVRGASGSGSPTDGNYLITGGGATKRSDIVIDNCFGYDSYRVNEDYAQIWLGNVDDWVISGTSIKNCYNQFGMFMQGAAGSPSTGGRITRCYVENSEKSPYRFYGQYSCLMSYCMALNCGNASHANKSNWYQGCHRCGKWACAFYACDGFDTWQEASSVFIGFCEIPVSNDNLDGRGINDQNHSTGLSPATIGNFNGDSYLLNNVVAPWKGALASTNSVTTGKSFEPNVLFGVKNNIFHGAATVDQTRLITNGWRNNLLTSGSALAASAGTDTTASYATVYEDVVRGNLAIKATSPSISAATASIAAEVAVLQSWFPDFLYFNRDLAGEVFNPASPPMGNYVNPLNPLPVKPVWVERPAIANAPLVGVALGASDGYLVGYPYPTLAYQWQRSTDLINWTNISGATSATYSPVSGDIGYYLSRLNPATNASGTTVCRSTSLIAVASSFPVSIVPLTPIKQLASTGVAGANNRETNVYALSGAPILVVASQQQATAANAVVTATVGTPSRSYGTGAALTNAGISIRTSLETDVFYILSPGAGNKTIQVQSNDNTYGHQVAVYEVPGLTGVVFGTPNGSTSATSRTSAITTTAINSLVLSIVTRSNGDKTTNPISVAAPDTLLLMDNSGGANSSTDLTTCIAYEQAPSIGSYGATFTWPTGNRVTCVAVELKS